MSKINTSRTHFVGVEGYRASNVITVGRGFIGTLSMVPQLNCDTAIATIEGVSITGATTIVATDLTISDDGKRADYTVPEMDTAGEYNVVVTVTTTDTQTLPTAGILRVE